MDLTLRHMWLSEMYRPCPEVPRAEKPAGQYAKWTAAAALEGFVSCHACGVVFRQPSKVKTPFKWCPECAVEVQA